MSFLKSFLGAAFAQSARDSKKRQEELDAWNALFDEATDMSLELSTAMFLSLHLNWQQKAELL